MKLRFWRIKEEEEKEIYEVTLKAPAYNREFFISENYKSDCKDKGLNFPGLSRYLIKRIWEPVHDFYSQWEHLRRNPINIEDIYRAQFKDFYEKESNKLKESCELELRNLICVQGVCPEKIKSVGESHFKKIAAKIREEKEDDIAFALEIKELRKEISDWVNRSLRMCF